MSEELGNEPDQVKMNTEG